MAGALIFRHHDLVSWSPCFCCKLQCYWGKGSTEAKIARKESPVAKLLQQLWDDESGQDIAEYAVMLAVILVIVVGTIRLIGSNANNVFSNVGSAIQ